MFWGRSLSTLMDSNYIVGIMFAILNAQVWKSWNEKEAIHLAACDLCKWVGFFFLRLTFIQRRRAGPIPTVTRRHWKSNIAQRGATAQMRSGTDISDFLFHFFNPSTSPPATTTQPYTPTHSLKTSQVISSPFQCLRKGSRACQPCLC